MAYITVHSNGVRIAVPAKYLKTLNQYLMVCPAPFGWIAHGQDQSLWLSLPGSFIER
jgi:hypothetical protein